MVRTVLLVLGVLLFVCVMVYVWCLMRISSMTDRMEEEERERERERDTDGVARNTRKE